MKLIISQAFLSAADSASAPPSQLYKQMPEAINDPRARAGADDCNFKITLIIMPYLIKKL